MFQEINSERRAKASFSKGRYVSINGHVKVDGPATLSTRDANFRYGIHQARNVRAFMFQIFEALSQNGRQHCHSNVRGKTKQNKKVYSNYNYRSSYPSRAVRGNQNLKQKKKYGKRKQRTQLGPLSEGGKRRRKAVPINAALISVLEPLHRAI